MKNLNRLKATVTSTIGTVHLTLRRQNGYICYPVKLKEFFLDVNRVYSCPKVFSWNTCKYYGW